MSRMNDDELTELLVGLPRHEASPGFTERVVSRSDDARARTEHGRRIAVRRRLAVAVAAALVIVWWGYGVWNNAGQVRSADRVEELRLEYQELQDEFRQLRELAEKVGPVLEMGRNEEPGLVFDFQDRGEPNQRNDGSNARPASHQGERERF